MKSEAKAAGAFFTESHQMTGSQSQLALIEGLIMNLGKLGVRIVAITSPSPDDGVRSFSRALCASYSAADVKSVLIDLDQGGSYDADDRGWNPGIKLEPQLVSTDVLGFDEIRVQPNFVTRPMFNNLDHLRRALNQDLGGYNAVVINLPPLIGADVGAPNAVAIARAADGVLLVCGTGRSATSETVKAVDDMKAAGCKVIGTVLDDSGGIRPGRDMADLIDNSRFGSQKFGMWLSRALRENQLLNN